MHFWLLDDSRSVSCAIANMSTDSGEGASHTAPTIYADYLFSAVVCVVKESFVLAGLSSHVNVWTATWAYSWILDKMGHTAPSFYKDCVVAAFHLWIDVVVVLLALSWCAGGVSDDTLHFSSSRLMAPWSLSCPNQEDSRLATDFPLCPRSVR